MVNGSVQAFHQHASSVLLLSRVAFLARKSNVQLRLPQRQLARFGKRPNSVGMKVEVAGLELSGEH